MLARAPSNLSHVPDSIPSRGHFSLNAQHAACLEAPIALHHSHSRSPTETKRLNAPPRQQPGRVSTLRKHCSLTGEPSSGDARKRFQREEFRQTAPWTLTTHSTAPIGPRALPCRQLYEEDSCKDAASE